MDNNATQFFSLSSQRNSRTGLWSTHVHFHHGSTFDEALHFFRDEYGPDSGDLRLVDVYPATPDQIATLRL